MDDTMEQMARDAEQRMLQDGAKDLTDKEFNLVLNYWGVRRMERSHAEQVTNGNRNGGNKDALKQYASSAITRFSLAALMALIKDFLSGGG